MQVGVGISGILGRSCSKTCRSSSDCVTNAHPCWPAARWIRPRLRPCSHRPSSCIRIRAAARTGRSTNHVNRERRVPITFRGYRMRGRRRETHRPARDADRRAADAAAARLRASRCRTSGRTSRRRSRPTAERARPAAVSAAVRRPHEIQGGEQKTHMFARRVRRRDVSRDVPLDWCAVAAPPRASTPEWYCRDCGAIPYLAPAADDPTRLHRCSSQAAIEGAGHVRAQARGRSTSTAGGISATSTATTRRSATTGPTPLVSHYNNQYDAVAGFARAVPAHRRRPLVAQMDELAAHVIDIDIYHTDSDKSAYNDGLFWHTYHYVRRRHRHAPLVSASRAAASAAAARRPSTTTRPA